MTMELYWGSGSPYSWRVLLADQMREALAVVRAEGIAPLSTTPLPASFTPFILKLPDALFARIARL